MYIRAHSHAFDCDPTDNEARWWIESHLRTYTYGIIFCLLTLEHQWIKRITKIARLLRSKINFICVDQETLATISVFSDEWVLRMEKGCVMGMWGVFLLSTSFFSFK